ncbi:conserved hypothetical protein [Ricinus communis]|uniref:Uncharacterized protein n=1 Tax=Ricinus communis TaxID=3988 RepID=B9SR41_RICCO|nr:conserved hypothetical protein [Ricinus communis]
MKLPQQEQPRWKNGSSEQKKMKKKNGKSRTNNGSGERDRQEQGLAITTAATRRALNKQAKGQRISLRRTLLVNDQ